MNVVVCKKSVVADVFALFAGECCIYLAAIDDVEFAMSLFFLDIIVFISVFSVVEMCIVSAVIVMR